MSDLKDKVDSKLVVWYMGDVAMTLCYITIWPNKNVKDALASWHRFNTAFYQPELWKQNKKKVLYLNL